MVACRQTWCWKLSESSTSRSTGSGVERETVSRPVLSNWNPKAYPKFHTTSNKITATPKSHKPLIVAFFGGQALKYMNFWGLFLLRSSQHGYHISSASLQQISITEKHGLAQRVYQKVRKSCPSRYTYITVALPTVHGIWWKRDHHDCKR